MIYTVTLNPALDYFVQLDQVKLGAINRSSYDYKAPGGKGINVSRVLKRLGHQSEALGFIGGFTGEYVKSVVEQEEIRTNFVQVDGDTRINVKIKSKEESEINGVSPEITDNHLNDLRASLSGLSEGDILVLAGSVPATIPVDIYATLCEEARNRNATVFIDTSGEPLRKVLKAKPTFIKPNHHELGELFSVQISSPKEAVSYAKELVKGGINYVIVSFAGDGAILATDNRILFANTPKGVVKNSVGAGDSVVAGFLAAVTENMSIEEAFKFAVATGSATAFSTGFCDRMEVERLSLEINIQETNWGKDE